MEDQIIGLVSDSKALNSKIFSLPKLLILISLENLGQDGATYTDLRAGLELKDGILHSNLKTLKKMGYVSEKKVKLDKKTLSAYSIAPEGKEALISIRSWFRKWLG
ncbi:MAG: transcriptional regulator [Candidatus Micrarchaeota archaeon]|nr:transcriptional regulator [Candidatus Micrarchaeota archaeon]